MRTRASLTAMAVPSPALPVRHLRLVTLLGASLAVWQPGRLAAQCPDGSAPPCGTRPASAPSATSLAVLYFENASPDTLDAYLADGLTEDVISSLSAISRLQVMSRHAVRRYRGRATDDPRALGRTLSVSYLVSGTVRRSGDRLVVTAELIRAGAGVQIWSERYQRSTGDLLAIQDDIARNVATGVAGRLLPEERATFGRHPTRNPDAHEHYLRGNFLLAQRVPHLFTRAVEEYRTALALDSDFSSPLGRLAYAHALALTWSWPVPEVPAESLLTTGLQLANRALGRNPRDADAWLGLGYLRTFRDPIRYEGAKEALQRARDLDPENPEAWHQSGSVLSDLGEDSAGAFALRRAIALDPQLAIAWIELSFLSTIGHRYQEALRLLDSAVIVAPGSVGARLNRAGVLLLLGDTAAAGAEADIVRGIGAPERAGLIRAQVAARSGNPAAVPGIRATIAEWTGTDPNGRTDISLTVASLVPTLLDIGDRETALRLLESLRARGRGLAFWLRWPTLDPLRQEPRFQRLVEELEG